MVFLGLSTSVFPRVLFGLTSRFLNLAPILDPEVKTQKEQKRKKKEKDREKKGQAMGGVGEK